MRLSHSARELYTYCPRSYKLKYIDGYRPKTLSSALFFGTAFGDTVQMIILDKKENLTEEEKKLLGSNPTDFFEDLITNVEINGSPVKIPKSPLIRYFASDYTKETLTTADILEIKEYREELGIQDFVDMKTLQDQMKLDNLDQDEISLMNFAYWKSLRRKGLMLIEEYIKEIVPKIVKVYEIEGKINIQNADKDEIVGFLDLVCDYEFEGGIKKVLMDHKTSSKRYGTKSIFEKKQLLLYNYDREIDFLGYIIGIKKLKEPKRGERKGEKYYEIQVMAQETDHDLEEEVIQEYDQVLQQIKAGEFPKVTDKNLCKYRFGKPCEFFDICYKNDDSGLFKKERK